MKVQALLVGLLAVSALAATREEKIAKGLRQIETSRGVSGWMTFDEVLNLIRLDVGFMDITYHPVKARKSRVLENAIPSSPVHQDEVKDLIDWIEIQNVKDNLAVFTSFNNRYYTASSGAESSDWLYETVAAIASNSSLDISVEKFPHRWSQNSVIARIPGSISQETVVIGSHQDSINMFSPANGRAPGADDDGSGSMSVVEIFRIIVESGFKPELALEFHWYSAEEVGLLGSQDVADAYAAEDAPVRSMLQIDMNGYAGDEPAIGLVTDYTSATLNTFIRALIDEYLEIGYVNSVCGYGCSDHASWTAVGYDASFPFEANFGDHNPLIHTPNDTIENVDFDHLNEWLKLGLAFAVELSYAA